MIWWNGVRRGWSLIGGCTAVEHIDSYSKWKQIQVVWGMAVNGIMQVFPLM